LKRELLGEKHPLIAVIEYDLSLALWKAFQLEDSMFLLKTAETTLEELLGNQHPIVKVMAKTYLDVDTSFGQFKAAMAQESKNQPIFDSQDEFVRK